MRGQSPQQEAANAGRRAPQPDRHPRGRPQGCSHLSLLPAAQLRVCLGNASVYPPESFSHSVHAGDLHRLHFVYSASWPLPSTASILRPALLWSVYVPLLSGGSPPSHLFHRSCLPSRRPFLRLSFSYLSIAWPAPHLLCLPLPLESTLSLVADLLLSPTPVCCA